MYNKKLLLTTLKNLDKTKEPAKKKDVDYNSKMGYRDDSPFRKKKSMKINTSDGTIDMSNTGIPLMANGRALAPYSGLHQFDTNEVIETPLVEAKKGGSKLYSSNLQATNRIYAKNKLFKKNPLLKKNPLFKKKNYKKKIYDPQAMYFQDGGENGAVVSGTETLCLDDGRCLETDQIQEMLDRGSALPKEVVNTAWGVVDQVYPEEGPGISAATAWKNLGVPTLSSRLGMSNPANCMWAAGSGWMCEPEFSDVSKTAFESNDKFISAVNKGTVPFTRVAKTTDSDFDSKEKGLLQPGDIINIKGPKTSHAMTFSHYREDGMPIYVDSNGKATDFDWNAGMWSGMKPGNGRTAYVSRFSPEMEYGEKIKALEEKARTNPTYVEAELTQDQVNKYIKGGYVVEEINDPSIPRLNTMQRGGPFAENPDIPVPPEELCEEGYAWDQEKNICVPLPDMKEWFTNWYANRTLPLDEINNKKYVALMKEKLPKYNPESTLLQRISELPDPTYVDIVDKNPKNMGQIIYDKDWNASGLEVKRSLRGNAKELGRTLAHEDSTLIDDPDSEVQFPAQNLVIDPGLVLFKDRWGDLKGKEKADAEDYYNYQTDPATDNIHSMIFEERFARGLKPDQVITAEDIEKWKKEAEESGELNQDSKNYNNALYSLLKLSKDSNALAKWFNELASNDRPVDENAPQYAKQGGSMGYNLGDEVDDATMRKLKRLGYTFEKI